MKYKIRAKQDMKYELQQTIACATFKIDDLHKKYKVKTFKGILDKMKKEDMFEYLFLTNVGFYLRLLSNLIHFDQKEDSVVLQNHLKALIETTKPESEIDLNDLLKFKNKQ